MKNITVIWQLDKIFQISDQHEYTDIFHCSSVASILYYNKDQTYSTSFGGLIAHIFWWPYIQIKCVSFEINVLGLSSYYILFWCLELSQIQWFSKYFWSSSCLCIHQYFTVIYEYMHNWRSYNRQIFFAKQIYR